MQRGVRAIEQHLHHDVIGARAECRRSLLAEDLEIADDVAQIARREHRRLLERKGAVVDHALALAIDQADRHAASAFSREVTT